MKHFIWNLLEYNIQHDRSISENYIENKLKNLISQREIMFLVVPAINGKKKIKEVKSEILKELNVNPHIIISIYFGQEVKN